MRALLEDLEAQTIANELEIIIVLTGSTQNERAIIEEFQTRYDNIVYICKDEREHTHIAVNRAIAAARGTYVTPACADDRHRKDAYEKMAAALDADPSVGLVYADSAVTQMENVTFENAEIIGAFCWPEFDRELLFHGNYVGPQPMWRRSLSELHGGFDEAMFIAADYELWLRFSSTVTFKHLPEILGLYYYNPEGNERANRGLCAKETRSARERYWPRHRGALPPTDNNFFRTPDAIPHRTTLTG